MIDLDRRDRTGRSADEANAAAALSVTGLTVRYGESIALRDVTLDFPARSITAVIGPSGCGKTTLLSCLNRLTDLIPSCRVEGQVRLGDTAIHDSRTDVVALRRRVGMIFQRPTPFPFSIRRNLELPLREHGGLDKTEIAARIEQTLREIGLWDEVRDRLDRPAPTLSGGQQQRLCLARALALRPEVILLDEPCGALDPISAGVVEDLILNLRERYTIVIVTHNLGQAKRLADRVALLWSDGRGGTLIEHGSTAQVFDAPRDELTAAYVSGRLG
ncbi:MAG: phosphate ABC transporter ATP-binding protein [Planctomycetaceae bacterium]